MNVKLLDFHGIIFVGLLLKYISGQTYTCSASAPCGCSANSAVLSKIVGGEPASSQTWGWAASLRSSSSNSHFCGGSIISAYHILTAAHCAVAVSSPSAVRVYVGSIYLSVTAQALDVALIHVHPRYSSVTYNNDIAILKLASPIDLTKAGVDIVCLPNVSSTILASQEYPAPNTNLIAIGWGYLKENSESVSATLQQVTVQAVAATSSYCQAVSIRNSSITFCAGTMPNGGKDTCQGDSGGPLLMFTSNNVWQQVGITSNGLGCARAGYPGLYTRVAAYQGWINDTMNHGNYIHHVLPMIFIPVISLIWL